MSVEEQGLAIKQWRHAEEPGAAGSENPADTEIDEVVVGILSRMYNYMMNDLKWRRNYTMPSLSLA